MHKLASPSKLPRSACAVHCRTPAGQAEVLCIGDSLTVGSASANWVSALAAAAPGWAAVNAGTNSQVRLTAGLDRGLLLPLHRLGNIISQQSSVDD